MSYKETFATNSKRSRKTNKARKRAFSRIVRLVSKRIAYYEKVGDENRSTGITGKQRPDTYQD